MTPSPSVASSPRAFLGARAHLGLALFFLGLAIYGSIVPLRYRSLSLEEAIVRWKQVCSHPISIESRSDFVANVLLFIPLGYLFMATLCVDRQLIVGLLAALLVLPLLFATSAAIEFSQLWFPDRTSSLNDVVAESAGAVVGATIWLTLGHRITTQARRVLLASDWSDLANRLLPGYLVFLVLVHVMPFDLTISPVEIWHKYKEGRIILLPFAAHSVGFADQVSKYFWNVAYFLPIGLLLGSRSGKQSITAAMALAAGVLITSGIEFLKLFVWSRYTDVTNVLTGTLAVLAGWAIARAWQKQGTTGLPIGVRAALFIAWTGVLVIANWYPFNFVRDVICWRTRLSEVSPIPFADLYFGGTPFHAFDQVLHKVLLFLPVGALLQRTASSAWPAVMAGFAISFVLEMGQLGLPSRYTSVTDVLIETCGAWMGYVLCRRLLV